jgi:predicted nucleic acid-binding protein
MNAALFLDASGWFGALSPRDQHHPVALDVYHRLLAERGTRLVTTNLVVAEVHALLVRAGGAAAGLQFLDRLRHDLSHEVVWSTPDLEQAAADRWLRAFRGVTFSLTDAVSFEVMRTAGLRRAFTFDRHFEAAGFERVPGE